MPAGRGQALDAPPPPGQPTRLCSSPRLGSLALLQATPSPTPHPSSPLSPFARAKAEALLRDHLPCLGCHELDGTGGRVGPTLSRLGRERTRAFVLAMIRDPQRTITGTSMPRIPLDEATSELIASYLIARPATRPAGPVVARPPAATGDSSGAALYARFCAPCHGETGDGAGPNARFLPVRPTAHADAGYMSRRPDDALYDAIATGGAVMGRSPRMPAFGATLGPTRIRALVRHLRALCRCEGPAWSRDPGRSR